MLPVLPSLWHVYPKAVIQEGADTTGLCPPCGQSGAGILAPGLAVLHMTPRGLAPPFGVSLYHEGFLQDCSFMLLPQRFLQTEHLTRTTGYHIRASKAGL